VIKTKSKAQQRQKSMRGEVRRGKWDIIKCGMAVKGRLKKIREVKTRNEKKKEMK
jgi:hypothetical protein